MINTMERVTYCREEERDCTSVYRANVHIKVNSEANFNRNMLLYTMYTRESSLEIVHMDVQFMNTLLWT